MKIWAIGDLHLGFSTSKWMDRFGEHWKSHHLKVEARWRERVAPGDIVLLPGDFSWAMKAEEAAIDFRWLAALPGRKVLIKGNHDYWWPSSKAKMRALLGPDAEALKKTAIVLDGTAIVGVRGCDLSPPRAEEAAERAADLERETREFALSIAHLQSLGGAARPPIALFHYPPFPLGESASVFTRMAEQAGCRSALYGHLHNPEEWARAFQGEANGIRYRLVSCDYLDFTPALIEEVP